MQTFKVQRENEDIYMIFFKSIVNVPADFTGVYKIISTGNIYHVKDGKRHNENGPSVIYKSGTEFWYINGLEHREDGPSTEYCDGSKSWYYKGTIYGHNDDFNIESWKEKVKELKYLESLEIFK